MRERESWRGAGNRGSTGRLEGREGLTGWWNRRGGGGKIR